MFGSTMWSGLASGITVTDQITDAGTISLNYIGGDTTGPSVISIDLASDAVDVPVTSRMLPLRHQPLYAYRPYERTDTVLPGYGSEFLWRKRRVNASSGCSRLISACFSNFGDKGRSFLRRDSEDRFEAFAARRACGLRRLRLKSRRLQKKTQGNVHSPAFLPARILRNGSEAGACFQMAGQAERALLVLDPGELIAAVLRVMDVMAGNAFHVAIPEKIGNGRRTAALGAERSMLKVAGLA